MKIPPHAKKLFIYGSINPAVAAMYRKAGGLAGVMIYLYVRWKMYIPDYITEAKSDWVKLSNIGMDRIGFGMDPKTKSKALRKLVKAELIDLDLIENSGKSPQARLIVK
tara:strand:+ start:132 stop:458 length:327 start_codon:yes stop_codon:yes gene_type:complete